MPNIITTEQLKCINTIVSKLHIDKEHKAMMVEGFTNGRETSSAKLYVDEAGLMIKHLKQLDPTEAQADKMRKKIISMAHELNWRLPGTKRVDMKRVDDWCKKYGFLKKSLDNTPYEDLPKLVSQFANGPYKHYISNL